MPSTHEELAQELIDRAVQGIYQMLEALPNVDEITLSDLEQATGKMGQAIMQHTLQTLVNEKQPPPPEQMRCQKCGGHQHRRGRRSKRVVTSRSEITVKREYYQCAECGTGFFPSR